MDTADILTEQLDKGMAANHVDKLMEQRRHGSVRRFHTERIVRAQTVAEHSFNMVLLARHLFPGDAYDPHFMWAVLTHDMGEGWVGDVRAPAKWADSALSAHTRKAELHGLERVGLSEHKLSSQQNAKLVMLDMLEALLFCWEESLLGNAFAVVPLKKLREALSLPVYWELGGVKLEAIFDAVDGH